MGHSTIYEKAKDYYNRGLWSAARLQTLVTKGLLTQAEYNEIVGA